MTDDQSSASQYVYVLSNESMPGMYKVGKTTSSPEQRMNQLYTTGVPTPFHLEVSIAVIEALHSERSAHKALADYRVSGRREFFKGDMAEIVAAILSAIDLYRIEYVRKPELLVDVNNEFAKQADRKVEFRKWLEEECLEFRAALSRLESRYEKLKKVQDHLKKSGIPEAEYCNFDTYTDGNKGQSGPGIVMLDMKNSVDRLKEAIEQIDAAMKDQDAFDRIYSSMKQGPFSYQLKGEKRNYESDYREQIFLELEGNLKRGSVREVLDRFSIHTASGEDPKYAEFHGRYARGSIHS